VKRFGYICLAVLALSIPFVRRCSGRPRVIKKAIGRAPACLAGLMSVLVPWSALAANDATPTNLEAVWSFTHSESAQPCYDQTFAIIYFKYDAARKVTSIWKRELNGEEHVIVEFPGVREPSSLSCSQDGRTIAAVADVDLNSSEQVLFLMRGKDTALYKIPHYWPFSKSGTYSLLAPDGKAIALPETPTLITGTDLLQDMKVFPDGNRVVFMDDYAYLDEENGAQKYLAVDGGWKAQGQLIKYPRNFGPNEIARCDGHDVASLIGVDSTRFVVFGEVSPSKKDWLARIGVRELFRKNREPVKLTNSYGACVFPLLSPDAPVGTIVGLARVDATGLQTFSLPYAQASLLDYDVYFSKDGCYVLIQLVGPEIELLRVQSERCQQSKG
jgi:hypothetical protein